MSVLVIVLLLAFLVESLTEYLFGKIFDQVETLRPFRWLLMYIAAGVGVLGCFLYGFDLLALLGGYLDGEVQTSWFGTLLTGLAVGRGSNYLHDLVGRFFPGLKSGAMAEKPLRGLFPPE